MTILFIMKENVFEYICIINRIIKGTEIIFNETYYLELIDINTYKLINWKLSINPVKVKYYDIYSSDKIDCEMLIKFKNGCVFFEQKRNETHEEIKPTGTCNMTKN